MIVPTAAVADDLVSTLGVPRERVVVIKEAPAGAFGPRPSAEVDAARERYGLPESYLLWVGGMRTPTRESASPSSPARRGRCHSCSSVRRAPGPSSCPA